MRSLKTYILEAFESTDEIKITKADNEILTAIAVNLKTLSKDSKDDSIFKDDEIKPYVKEAIKLALLGPDYKNNRSVSKKNGELKASYEKSYQKFVKIYSIYKDDIYDIDTSSFDDDIIISKVKHSDVKDEFNNKWEKQGTKNGKRIDKTPKSDLMTFKYKDGIFELSETLSVKDSSGAQAMSGNFSEAFNTIFSHSEDNNEKTIMSDEARQILISLFKDEAGNEIDWNGVDKDRNEKLTETFRKLFDNKESNEKLIVAILAEAITGVNKFNKGAKSVPDSILTVAKNGKLIVDDVTTYIFRVYQQLNAKSFRICQKSEDLTKNSRAVFRINLPTHTEQFDDLTKEEEEKFKDILSLIKSTISKPNKESQLDDFEDIMNDEENDEIKNDKNSSKDTDDIKDKDNPANEWHRRKRKNSSYMTKSYYNSKGDAITSEEYKRRVDAYKKAKHKNN